jgi:hypothetical protein
MERFLKKICRLPVWKSTARERGRLDHGRGLLDYGRGLLDYGRGLLDYGRGRLDYGRRLVDYRYGRGLRLWKRTF